MFSSKIFISIILRSWITFWNFVNLSIWICSQPFIMSRDVVIGRTCEPMAWSYIIFQIYPHQNHNFLPSNFPRILYLRHKIMTILALSTISVFSTYVRHADIDNSPFNASINFSCVKIACISSFHNPKLLSPENYSIFHLSMVLTCKQYPFIPWWAPLVIENK